MEDDSFFDKVLEFLKKKNLHETAAQLIEERGMS
jgi:hypothetical protein